jgi:rhomboid domain-containing protein 1
VLQISQLPVKPPVTLALIGANVFVHLSSPVLFGTIDMGVRSICLNPRVIISSFMSFGRLEVARLLLSGFVHGDDMHLYYNMVSLLWKGVHLEGAIGSAAFAQLCAFALIVSHTLVVLLAWTLSQVRH